MKEYLKSVKFRIETLWSVLGGFGLVVFIRIIESGSPDDSFELGTDIFESGRWLYTSSYGWSLPNNTDNFLFGFVITAIIIWSVKVYQRN